MRIRRDEDGRIIGTDGEDQEHDDTQAAAQSALLHFSSPRDAATIAAFLRTRVYRPESLVWLQATKPYCDGGTRTKSPACTPCPTTSRSKWA